MNQLNDNTNEITPKRLAKYFDVTNRAIKKVKILSGEMTIDMKEKADDFFNMANCYFNDAKHFEKQKKIVLAYGALNYAHGWLDAGARLGLFDVDNDDVLFTVDGKPKS